MNKRLIEIKKWLLDKGLTQKNIADDAGVSHTAVHQFCRGIIVCSRVKEVFQKYNCPKELIEGRMA
ncbi:MAG: hypothetical protein A2W80_13740 [Candidatus Riflebacteria bacterium GWC2_50_8]|nr:MAG: hypothetical protein A2W80_13740 [Candidatus Riflebacteria bacterium GWC2_50_8]